MFELHAPGVFLVRYREKEDLAPERQVPLVDAMRSASRTGRIGVVFDVGPAVHWVDVSVPTFWLEITADPSVRLQAMAVVTTSIAVEIAVIGFAAANAIRRTGLDVRSFPALGAALDWASSAVGATPGFATI
jgi:hypothetical protein